MPTDNKSKPTGNHTCSDHIDLVAAVASIRALLKWLLAVFVIVMALNGYNIRETQQVKVVVAGLVENVAGKIAHCDLKIDNIEKEQLEIKQDLNSLDSRVKKLEVGNGGQ